MNYPKIIVYMADDDADDRFFMRKSLTEFDPSLTIVEAEDGDQLMTMLGIWSAEPTAQPVHLILLDMNMPKLNGLDTLLALKANPRFRDIPTVMISTVAEPQQVALAYKNGVNGFIQKPASYTKLDQIAQALSLCFLNAMAN